MSVESAAPATKFAIFSGWLTVEVDRCTCAAPGYHGLHEPGCGLEPVIQLSQLEEFLRAGLGAGSAVVELPDPDEAYARRGYDMWVVDDGELIEAGAGAVMVQEGEQSGAV